MSVRKLIILILFSSITSIILFSALPVIAETLYADSPDFEKLSLTAFQKNTAKNDGEYTITEFYTFHSMQKRSNNYAKYGLSENEQIKDLSDQLGLIYNCFWVVFLISLFTYIGLTLNVAQKFSSSSQLLMLTGCLIILFNFLIIFLHLRFMETVNISENISLAYITPDIHMKYFHLIMLTSSISLIGSLAYTGYVLPFIVKQKRINKKQRFDNEKILTHPIQDNKQELIKKIPLIPADPIFKERAILAEAQKHEKLKEQWLKEQQAQQNRRKTFASSEIKTIIQQKPDYHQSIKRIPPKTVKDGTSSEREDIFGSRENMQEKYFQEKKILSDRVEGKHKQLEKQLQKEDESFKSGEKIMQPREKTSVESFEQPLPFIVKREIIDEKQENIKKTPLIQVEPVFKEKIVLAENVENEKLKEQWLKEQQAKQNIRKTFKSKETKTIIEEAPDDHQPIQRIPPKTVTGRTSSEMQEDLFGSRENVEEKYFQEKRISLEKRESMMESLFEPIEIGPSDQGKGKHKQLASEKNIEKPFSSEKKQFYKKKELFKSEEKLTHLKEDKVSQKPTEGISAGSFEQTLFSAIEKKKKERKKQGENKKIIED